MIPLIPLTIGFGLFYLGTVVTTCTQCDTGSMVTGAILSLPFYIIGLFLVTRQTRAGLSSRLCLLALPGLFYQIWIAALFTYAVTIRHGCGCWAYGVDQYPIGSGYQLDPADLWTGPVLLTVALVSVLFITLRALPARR